MHSKKKKKSKKKKREKRKLNSKSLLNRTDWQYYAANQLIPYTVMTQRPILVMFVMVRKYKQQQQQPKIYFLLFFFLRIKNTRHIQYTEKSIKSFSALLYSGQGSNHVWMQLRNISVNKWTKLRHVSKESENFSNCMLRFQKILTSLCHHWQEDS